MNYGNKPHYMRFVKSTVMTMSSRAKRRAEPGDVVGAHESRVVRSRGLVHDDGNIMAQRSLNEMPVEILANIMSFLPDMEQLRLAEVSRGFRDIVRFRKKVGGVKITDYTATESLDAYTTATTMFKYKPTQASLVAALHQGRHDVVAMIDATTDIPVDHDTLILAAAEGDLEAVMALEKDPYNVTATADVAHRKWYEAIWAASRNVKTFDTDGDIPKDSHARVLMHFTNVMTRGGANPPEEVLATKLALRTFYGLFQTPFDELIEMWIHFEAKDMLEWARDPAMDPQIVGLVRPYQITEDHWMKVKNRGSDEFIVWMMNTYPHHALSDIVKFDIVHRGSLAVILALPDLEPKLLDSYIRKNGIDSKVIRIVQKFGYKYYRFHFCMNENHVLAKSKDDVNRWIQTGRDTLVVDLTGQRRPFPINTLKVFVDTDADDDDDDWGDEDVEIDLDDTEEEDVE